MRCRINELRDNYGTFMVRNGLIKEEVDLLQAEYRHQYSYGTTGVHHSKNLGKELDALTKMADA